MKRLLFLAAVLGLGLALSAMSYRTQLAGELLRGMPASEFQLFLRLNGSPVYAGHTSPKADAGTIGSVDGGIANILKTQCYAAACVCPGLTCTCGNLLANAGAATNGELLAANAVVYTVLSTSNGMVTTAAASGSLLLDGGSGAECDHWSL